MVVILDPKHYDDWLACTVDEAARYFRQWQGELLAEPDPLLRAPRAMSGKVVIPPPRPESGELF